MSATATFHQQLIQQLRDLIRSRQFAPGAQFLTEREIAGRFDTSRPTANKALSSLVAEGLLEFRKGAGTFVREGVLDYDLQRLVSFTDKALAAGKKPHTRVLEYKRMAARLAPEAVRTALQAAAGETLIYMERLRLADGQPVIFERRHVVERWCSGMTKADARGSLYACWTDKCGLVITGADEVIRAVNATGPLAQRLAVPEGAACFQIIATGFAPEDQPLWHEETWYRSDLYEFRNQIGGVAAARSAVGSIRTDAIRS